MTSDEIIDAEARAEDAIRNVLLNLEDETGLRVDWVRVDTRNFAGCETEVSLAARPARVDMCREAVDAIRNRTATDKGE